MRAWRVAEAHMRQRAHARWLTCKHTNAEDNGHAMARSQKPAPCRDKLLHTLRAQPQHINAP